MDVKQIREEIAKIDSLLATVDSDIKKLTPLQEPIPREVIEDEYLTLISALGSSGGVVPFPSLSGEDDSQSGNLDAFTFFGLVQAFLDDPIVLSCLARTLVNLVGVTGTQLEDSIVTVERISDVEARREILVAIIDRIIIEIERGKIGPDFTLVAVCCQRLGSEFHPAMVRLLQLPGWDHWPVHIQVELAAYLSQHTERSELILRFIECVVGSAIGADGSQLDRNLKLHSPRTAFQMLKLLRQLSLGTVPSSTLVSYVEKSCKSSPLAGQVRQMSDAHHLAMELAHIETDATSPAWVALAEKLSTGLGVYEVAGTLIALEKTRIYSDNFFSNILSVKKRVGAMTKSDLTELCLYLLLVGDKSSGSAVTKFIFDRRDLFVDDPFLLALVLELAAIASVDSGTIIPDAILLFKKHQDILRSAFGDRFAAVAQVLLPSADIRQTFIDERIEHGHLGRIQKCLETIGFVEDESTLVRDSPVDGLAVIDFVFPNHKTCIIIERESVFNVSSKKSVVSGRTAMTANILAQRRGWKVIVVIPELYTDDKSLISLLWEPLKKIEINSDFVFNEIADLNRIFLNQKIRSLRTETSSLVDLGKLLFHILRSSVTVRSIRIANLVCGDQAFSLLLNEFMATYIVKNKSEFTLEIDSPGPLSVEPLMKLIEAMNFSGNASGPFGSINLRIGLSQEVKDHLITWWGETHGNSQLKVIDGTSRHVVGNAIVLF